MNILNFIDFLLGRHQTTEEDTDTEPVATPASWPAPTSPTVALDPLNPLAGKRLRYLIGSDADVIVGRINEVAVVGYDVERPPFHGIGVGYCNLFDEKKTGAYGPYRRESDTAKEYDEGEIDPRGPGFEQNLVEQLVRRHSQGFSYVELDNPDAYTISQVIGAINMARLYGLGVVAKNPGLMEDGDASVILRHENVYGVVVERDAGTPADTEAMRTRAGKPSLPVWFVAHGSGKAWADQTAKAAIGHVNMYVTYSTAGEYGNSVDVA